MKTTNNSFQLGFKSKLILMITIVSSVTLISSNWYSFNLLEKQLRQTIYNEIDHSLSVEATKIEGNVQRTIDTVNAVAEEIRNPKHPTPKEVLMHYGAKFGGILKVVVGYDDGTSYTSRPSASFPNGVGIPEKYNPTTRSWYKQAKQTMGLSFSDLFFTKSDSTPMIGVMYAFPDSVILADIRFNEVEAQLLELENIYQAKGVMVDEKGMVVASTVEGIDGQSLISSLPTESNFSHATQNTEQFINGELNGQSVLLMAKIVRVGSEQWYMISVINPDVAFATLNNIILSEGITIFLTIVGSIIFIMLTVNRLYRPIVSLRDVIDDLSKGNGDLTQRLEVKTKDDLGQIAGGVNHFIEHIQNLMLKVERASTELRDNVQQLENKSDENSHMLNKHVQETEQIVTAIEEMSATADTVAQNASETAQSTKVASELGGHSLSAVGSAQDKVSELVSEVENTATDLQSMSEESKGISEILAVIGDIADQTNLLALNAAIEAARAGEQGRGFAVVADEVRALASRTQASTEEIDQALARLLSVNDSVAQSMGRTKATCNETFSNTEKVGESLNELTGHVAGINDLSLQIATAAEEQSSVTQEVSRNMNALNDIVNELNKNGAEVLSQTNSISDINTQLVSMVKQFKLR
ncbi:methyl-accepting chemotaxis protein [Vibrio sp. JC009]|uniref:methyl-accepting chemotaxis protein n=1 Tax=Vibrio sp. JC009 TaxID=2912314 RepID=UPI0023B019CD|nr:methyl-accepting chemotaxis protein [Vibrio sp. JC009]WED23787.1 methyl-accepting chemotaxis protein [Vibrio sp. JC009]